MTNQQNPVAKEIAAACLGVRARTIGRAISAVYDDALRDHGVSVAQLNILALVGNYGAASPGFITKTLAMEKSTVSRNVERMIKKRWIVARPLGDGRRQELELTAAGEGLLADILEDWRRANRKVAALLGKNGSAAIHLAFDRMSGRGD